MTVSVLNKPTLVLNKNWQAISVESVKDSVAKAFTGAAKLMDHEDFAPYTWEEWLILFTTPFNSDLRDDYDYISTAHFKVRAPEVVVLTEYDRIPKLDVKLTRRNLFIRDKFRCQYTGEKVSMKEGTIDHVMPKSRGGLTTWDNVVLASMNANVKKANRLPHEAGMKLRSQPKKPNWHPLFTYSVSKHPKSWDKFINTDQWNEIGYWDVELVD